jgi:CRP-like cAMP-binding protein
MSSTSLPRSGILAFMDDAAREQFGTYGNIVTTATGEELVHEGKVNTRLYVVLAGTFNIYCDVSGHQVLLDTVGVGDCIGEVAMFNR